MRVCGDRQTNDHPVPPVRLTTPLSIMPRAPFAAFLWLRNRFTRDTLAGARHPLHCVCVVLHGGAGSHSGNRAYRTIDAPLVWLGLAGKRVSFLTATGNVK